MMIDQNKLIWELKALQPLNNEDIPKWAWKVIESQPVAMTYEQGYKDGQEALREEMQEYERDRLD